MHEPLSLGLRDEPPRRLGPKPPRPESKHWTLIRKGEARRLRPPTAPQPPQHARPPWQGRPGKDCPACRPLHPSWGAGQCLDGLGPPGAHSRGLGSWGVAQRCADQVPVMRIHWGERWEHVHPRLHELLEAP